MSLAVEAGLSLTEFYDCEFWEVSAIVDGFNQRRSEEYKNGWVQSRFILSGMSKEAHKVKFPWEQSTITKEIWDISRKNFAKWAENHRKKMKQNE